MFSLINGIGENLAKTLTEKFGEPKSLDEAYELIKDIELPKAAEQDVKYRPLKIIPRRIIEYIESDFKLSIPFMFCGSYRRMLPMSGDIDIVIIGEMQTVIDELDNELYEIIDPYAAGPDRISCLVKIKWLSKPMYVKIDFFVANEDNFAYMIYYATGSKQYNIKMRIVARKKGLLLNQYGIYTKKKELLPAKTEEEICNHLGVKYLEPYLRL